MKSHEFMHQHDGLTDDIFTPEPFDESHDSGGIKSKYSQNPKFSWQNAIDLGRKKLPYIGQEVFERIKKEANPKK